MGKGKHWDRLSAETLEADAKGRIFVSGAAGGRMIDLSGVRFLGARVDTVKQLYRGRLRTDILERLEADTSGGGRFWPSFYGPGAHVARAPYESGYKYKIQNNEEGYIVFVKSFYHTEEVQASHVKVELSPKFISQRGTKQVQQQLDLLARQFLSEVTGDKVAVHLAVDVQGWEPPEDFRQRFVSRSRRVQEYEGIESVQFSGIREVAVMYGDRETFMWGAAAALQFTAYRKDKEIVRSDKVDYWHREWDGHTFGQWDPEAPVWRFEARFHHQVVSEAGNGCGEDWRTFEEVAEHLGDLWRYALRLNRLDFTSSFIDPFWQLLIEEPEWYRPATGLWIRRAKKESVSTLGRNYGVVLGNIVTVGARMKWDIRRLMRELHGLSFWQDVLAYYRSVGVGQSELRNRLEKRLLERRLLSKWAA